ncbi:hypothetical protein BAUCODRAFT_186673 [Baudoinia panamericana UAMH 10762]|uniref:Uncharacterized protein n=1 Tax=Baudoinia panamericana (strain UAMH 10762) TaxID=717646 RepID=M2NMT0_BAUPA|nr:uncharacterized protein BAUCODRAFT_186673 [Baudoinia panamericana UAMH 10762]EMD00845.1 hypothetical protein BAUCODRAFT_186673 [Baudoinia panamericana UAMH 10762]
MRLSTLLVVLATSYASARSNRFNGREEHATSGGIGGVRPIDRLNRRTNNNQISELDCEPVGESLNLKPAPIRFEDAAVQAEFAGLAHLLIEQRGEWTRERRLRDTAK